MSEAAGTLDLADKIDLWLGPAGGRARLVDMVDTDYSIDRALDRIKRMRSPVVSGKLRKALNAFGKDNGLEENGWEKDVSEVVQPAYVSLTREYHDTICNMQRGCLNHLVEEPYTIYALELRTIDAVLKTPYERPMSEGEIATVAGCLYRRQIAFCSHDGGRSYRFDWGQIAGDPLVGATRGFVVQADGRLHLVGYNQRMDATYLVLKPGRAFDMVDVAWAGFQSGTCEAGTTGFSRRVALLKGEIGENTHPLQGLAGAALKHMIEWLACGVRAGRNPAFAVDLRVMQ